jgi:hypothetical protein
VRAQDYTVDWYAIDGGGGTSGAGQFTLTGTIGQPGAGDLSGGQFSLKGGVMGMLALVQTVGAPTLRIQATGTNTIIIAWPASASGFSLQQNSNLANGNWAAVTNSVNVVGSENQVVIVPVAGNSFYRLIQQ